MEDVDIYADLPSIHIEEHENDNVNDNENQLNEKAKDLEKELSELRSKLEKLEGLNVNLKTNFSSLIKTAKKEISRKDRTITELRSKLDNITFRRNQRQNNRYNGGFSNGYNNSHINGYNNYTAPEALPNQELLLRNQEFQTALIHQFSYPPPLLPTNTNVPTSVQYQYQNQLLYSSLPVEIEVAHTEAEYIENEDFKQDTKPKYDKKESKVSSYEEDDEFINKSCYVSTVYGERLRKRLMLEKENEERKKQEELKLSKEKENGKRKTDNELKFPEEKKQIKINKIKSNVVEGQTEKTNEKKLLISLMKEIEHGFQGASVIVNEKRNKKNAEKSQIFKKQNHLKLSESEREIETESNKLKQIEKKEIQTLGKQTSTNELKKESKDFKEVIRTKDVRTRQSQRLEEKASKMEAKEIESQRMKEEASKMERNEKESQRLKEEASKREVKEKESQRLKEEASKREGNERESQKLEEKAIKDEIKSRESQRIKEVSKEEAKESESQKLKEKIDKMEMKNTSKTSEEIVNNSEIKSRELQRLEENASKNENKEFFNDQSSKRDNEEKVIKTFEDEIQNIYSQPQVQEVKYNNKRTEADELRIVQRTNAASADSEREEVKPKTESLDKVNNKENLSFMNKLCPIDTFVYAKTTEDTVNNLKNSDIPKVETNLMEREDFLYSREGPSHFNNKRYDFRKSDKYWNSNSNGIDFQKSDRYWNSNTNGMHTKFKNYPNYHCNKNNHNFRHKNYRHEDYHNYHDRHKNKYNIEVNHRHSRQDYSKMEKYDRHRSSDRSKSRHRESSSNHRHREYDFDKEATNLENKHNQTPKKIQKKDKTQKSNEKKKKHKDKTPKKSPKRKRLLDSENELSPKCKRRKTEINNSVDITDKSNTLIDENVPLPCLISIHENLLKKKEFYETLEEGEILDSVDSVLEFANLNLVNENSAAKTEANVEPIVEKELDIQESNRTIEKIAINNERVKLPKTDNVNRIIAENITNQTTKEGTSKLEELKNQENNKIERVEEILSSLCQQLETESIDSNKLDKETNPTSDFSEILNSVVQSNQIINSDEKHKDLNKKIVNSENKYSKSPRNKTKESMYLSIEGKEVKTPKKKTKKESNETKQKIILLQDKVEVNASLEITENNEGKEVKTPGKNAKEKSNIQENNNMLSRKTKEQMKNPALEETENTEGEEVKTPEKNAKKESNIQEDNNVLLATKVKEQMKNPALEETENTEGKEVKTPRKKAKKESDALEDNNMFSRKCKDEIKNSSLEKTGSTMDNCTISNQTKTPRKYAKKECKKIELENTSLERPESTQVKDLKTPRKKVKKESCKHKHKSKKKSQKEDEVKNISLEETKIFKDSLVELPRKKAKKEFNKEDDKKENEIKSFSLQEIANTEHKELIPVSKKPKNESNNQEKKNVLQIEISQVKNTSLKENESTEDVEVKTLKKKVKESNKPEDQKNDNLRKEENEIKNTTLGEHKNSENSKVAVANTKEAQIGNSILRKQIKDYKVKDVKEETKKTQEDPNIMKKQLMKSLFGSDSPVKEKVLDSHSYRRTIVLPKNLKNVIYVKRRRRPVQLSDSPPVVVIDHTKTNKSK